MAARRPQQQHTDNNAAAPSTSSAARSRRAASRRLSEDPAARRTSPARSPVYTLVAPARPSVRPPFSAPYPSESQIKAACLGIGLPLLAPRLLDRKMRSRTPLRIEAATFAAYTLVPKSPSHSLCMPLVITERVQMRPSRLMNLTLQFRCRTALHTSLFATRRAPD